MLILYAALVLYFGLQGYGMIENRLNVRCFSYILKAICPIYLFRLKSYHRSRVSVSNSIRHV